MVAPMVVDLGKQWDQPMVLPKKLRTERLKELETLRSRVIQKDCSTAVASPMEEKKGIHLGSVLGHL